MTYLATSTNIVAEDKKDYSKDIEKFDAHFKVRRNVIFERVRFNERDQLVGESIHNSPIATA